jgi:hypothetical protein
MEIPIPDDPVRLEAESVIVGLQEQMIDTTARRQILNFRLNKAEESNDKKTASEVRSELSQLKDAPAFLMDLEQIRQRYKSDDPIVQQRMNRLFEDTKKAINKM